MFLCFVLIFFIKPYVVDTHSNCIDVDAIQMGTHTVCKFELYRQVDAIQMGTRNICLYKEVVKKVYWV